MPWKPASASGSPAWRIASGNWLGSRSGSARPRPPPRTNPRPDRSPSAGFGPESAGSLAGFPSRRALRARRGTPRIRRGRHSSPCPPPPSGWERSSPAAILSGQSFRGRGPPPPDPPARRDQLRGDSPGKQFDRPDRARPPTGHAPLSAGRRRLRHPRVAAADAASRVVRITPPDRSERVGPSRRRANRACYNCR